MEHKNEKICRCGRIIIDPKNITGLCPRCQKTILEWGGPAVLAALTYGATYVVNEFGPSIVKGVKDTMKNHKK